MRSTRVSITAIALEQRSERRHFRIIELPSVVAHESRLSFQRGDHRRVEVDFLELLRAAQPPRTEHVDLHEFVSDDVESHQEHAVLDQLGADDLGHFQVGFGDLHLTHLAAGVEVAANVIT